MSSRSFNYLSGSGGVNTPGALQANVCPRGIEHSSNGECSGFISSLASTYKLAPGTRSIFNTGPYVLQPFQYQYEGRIPCSSGFAPQDAGYLASCRRQGTPSGTHLPQEYGASPSAYQRMLPSAQYPYNSQYTYNY